VHRTDQHGQVVTQNLAQHFFLHGQVGFAANRVPELRFDCPDGRFDIAPLVIVAQELVAVKVEIVERLGEESATIAGRARSERDIRRDPVLRDFIEILRAGVCLQPEFWPPFPAPGTIAA
jgi:hypothetical protein